MITVTIVMTVIYFRKRILRKYVGCVLIFTDTVLSYES